MHIVTQPNDISTAVGSETARLMRDAATTLLASLSPEQESTILFPVDDAERRNWDYRPKQRAGLALSGMDGSQRKLALALLAGGLSRRGHMTALNIMSLEKVLGQIEGDGGHVRNPDLYHVAIFGTPADDAPWGWRFEGHHLSVNILVVAGRRIAPTPNFFGANPARIPDGPLAGFRTLPREEDRARSLLEMLDETGHRKALIREEAPADILTRWEAAVKIDTAVGLPASEMTEEQLTTLRSLIAVYTGRMPREVADQRQNALEKAGMRHVHFAWAGGAEPGKPHYYRIHGPSFLVEYDNTQNLANHIHSVWRDPENDWGEDLLRTHYRQDHEPGQRDGHTR